MPNLIFKFPDGVRYETSYGAGGYPQLGHEVVFNKMKGSDLKNDTPSQYHLDSKPYINKAWVVDKITWQWELETISGWDDTRRILITLKEL